MIAYNSALRVLLARGSGLFAAFAFFVYVAHRFGGDRATDVAFTALNIPNAIVIIIALFPPLILSVFKSLEVGQGVEEARRFGRSALRVLTIATTLLTGTAILLSPLLAQAVLGGYSDAEVALVTRYMQVGFLVIVFAGVASVFKAVLNATGSYVLPSLETFVTNAVAIGVIAIASELWGAFAIVAGVTAGAFARMAVMVPGFLSRTRGGGGPFFHPAMREVGRALWPLVVNGLLFVSNVSIIRALAWRIPMKGALSYLYYSERLILAPYDLFVSSMAVISLPSLAQRSAEGNLKGLGHQVTVGIRMSSWFGIPAAVGLVLLAEPLVAFLYQHGQFDATATRETAFALRYSAPLLVFSGIGIVHLAFYALRETRSILISGVAVAATHVGLGAALVGSYRQGGLALASSISFLVGFGISLWLFARKAGWSDLRSLGEGALRTCGATALMALAVWALGRWTQAHVLLRIAAGVSVFAMASLWLCPEEWAYLKRLRPGYRPAPAQEPPA